MTTWKVIRNLRMDMSQYVVHCTRYQVEEDGVTPPWDVLRKILSDGFLRATYAVVGARGRPTVRGPYPAVCFTEQPLQFFLQSVRASGSRYTEFAVAVRKDDLFFYGGRPVIYDDDRVLGRLIDEPGVAAEAMVYDGGLPREQQYRWVGYDPTALWGRADPVDWTHEREWRSRPNEDVNQEIGLLEAKSVAIPLQFPTLRPGGSREPRFVVLVDTDERRGNLLEWIANSASEIAERGEYWEAYAEILPRAPVMSFETIKTTLDASGNALGRLEDFDPLSAAEAV